MRFVISFLYMSSRFCYNGDSQAKLERGTNNIRNHSPHKGRFVFAVALLAILCIGGTELAVCRIADPELYDQITAPVRNMVRSCKDSLSSVVRDIFAPSPSEDDEAFEAQLAEEPEDQDALILSDPAVTKLVVRGDQEVLTGGTVAVTYFNQSEPPWAEALYGQDPIDKFGCGPTTMAVVVASLSGEETDPAEMARWASDHGYWAPRSGSYLSIVEGTAKAYGLRVESRPDIDAEGLQRALSAGHMAVALMTKGHFTNSGHFILLRGTTLDGGILVADPNSRDRSLVAWDAQLIVDELSKSRAYGAPLWLLSTIEPPRIS